MASWRRSNVGIQYIWQHRRLRRSIISSLCYWLCCRDTPKARWGVLHQSFLLYTGLVSINQFFIRLSNMIDSTSGKSCASWLIFTDPEDRAPKTNIFCADATIANRAPQSIYWATTVAPRTTTGVTSSSCLLWLDIHISLLICHLASITSVASSNPSSSSSSSPGSNSQPAPAAATDSGSSSCQRLWRRLSS